MDFCRGGVSSASVRQTDEGGSVASPSSAQTRGAVISCRAAAAAGVKAEHGCWCDLQIFDWVDAAVPNKTILQGKAGSTRGSSCA